MKKENIKGFKILLIVLSIAIIVELVTTILLWNSVGEVGPEETQRSDRVDDSDDPSLPVVHTVAKPVLYLYPEKTTEVSVEFIKPEQLTTTYPTYTDGWNVTAHPNGDLYDSNNNYYYALYWESDIAINDTFNSGFYVKANDSTDFLEEKLSQIGLNSRERNEFIMYWLPRMEKGGNNLVYFMLTDEVESAEPISITPKPDSLLRVRILIKKTDDDPKLPEQDLSPTFVRHGFTAVEWGGTEIKDDSN